MRTERAESWTSGGSESRNTLRTAPRRSTPVHAGGGGVSAGSPGSSLVTNRHSCSIIEDVEPSCLLSSVHAASSRVKEENIKKSILLVIVVLGTACLIACQTAGTQPQSKGAGETQAQPPSSQAVAGTQEQLPSPQGDAETQAPAPAESASRNGIARSTGSPLKVISAQAVRFMDGTAKLWMRLISAISGQKTDPARAIEYAAVAVAVIAIGAASAVRIRRNRRLA